MRTATGHGCFGTGGRRWLARLELPVDERLTLDGCLRQVDFLDAEIAALDGEIATQALAWPEVLRLMSVPGVNVQTAATFMAAVGDIGRFSSPRKLVSYLGLDPRVRQSGRTPARHGRISKAGASEGIDTTTIRFTPARSPSFCRFRAAAVKKSVGVSNARNVNPREPNGEERELVRLVRRIQTLTAELDELRRHAAPSLEVQAKERTLEQLRWRLVALARGTATGLGRRRVTTTAASTAARTAGRLRGWLSVRHSLRSEAVVVLALYGLYELVRAIVVGDNGEADRHAQRLVALGRSLHLLFEASVQRAAHALPGPHSGRKSGNP